MSVIPGSIALIACSAKKLQTQTAVPAADLYQGQLFKAQLAYAQNTLGLFDHQIYVMSARYYLVPIRANVLPYNEALVGKPLAEREEWARRVMAELCEHRYPFGHVYLLGGRLYTEPMTGVLRSSGYPSSVPHPAGLGYAKQVQWYKEQVKQCGM